MFTQGFKVSGSSLALMRPGERGVVTRFRSVDERVNEKLMAMGVMPGSYITLEQRSPRFIIKSGARRVALDNRMIQSIYVRLTE